MRLSDRAEATILVTSRPKLTGREITTWSLAVFSIAMVLIIFAAAAGSGIMVAVMAWFLFRMKSLESGGPDVKRLAEDLDDLRTDLLASHAQVKDLAERLDFTERLLSAGDDRDEERGP